MFGVRGNQLGLFSDPGILALGRCRELRLVRGEKLQRALDPLESFFRRHGFHFTLIEAIPA